MKKIKNVICSILSLFIFMMASIHIFAENNSFNKNESNEIILSKPGDIIVKDNGKSMDQILMESQKKTSFN